MAEQTNDLGKLGPALAKAWVELSPSIQNDAHNPHFGNNYASLEAVLKAAKPIFGKYQLAVVQHPGPITFSPDGSTALLSLTTVVLHESGERLALTAQAPIQAQWDKKAGVARFTAPAMGSATAYLRRYCFLAVCGFAQTDDDGGAAMESGSEPPPVNVRKEEPKEEAPVGDPSQGKRGPGRPPKQKAEEKPEGDSKAILRAKLEEWINTATTSEQLEKAKQKVIDLKDDAVGKLYVAKMRELKGKKENS